MSITIIEIVILLLVAAFAIYLVTPRSKFGNYTGLREQISRDEYLDIVELLEEAKKLVSILIGVMSHKSRIFTKV